jgi:hypothetical protein
MINPLECIPCLCRETVRAVRQATADPATQDAVLGEALFHLAMRDRALTPDELAADLQTLIATRTGHPIPPLTTHAGCSHAKTAAPFPSHENRPTHQ